MNRKDKPWIYIASPYTKGDVGINIRCSIDAYNKLLDTGLCVPLSPIVIGFQAHLVQPRSWQDWMEADLDLLSRCDACLRLTATWEPLQYYQQESTGADMEVGYCIDNDIPVFTGLFAINDWLVRKTRGKATIATPEPYRLKVVAVSNNANSFGLRQMVLISTEGDAWFAHANSLNVRPVGTVIESVPDTDVPSRLVKMGYEMVDQGKIAVTTELFKETWPGLPVPPKLLE